MHLFGSYAVAPGVRPLRLRGFFFVLVRLFSEVMAGRHGAPTPRGKTAGREVFTVTTVTSVCA